MSTKGPMRDPERTETPSADDDGGNEGDLFFDQWVTAKGPDARTLVTSAIGDLQRAEKQQGLRKRARRAGDQQTHSALVETVIANLAYAVIEGRERSVAVSLAKGKKQTRYDRPIFRLLPRLLDRLSQAGYLVLDKSPQLGRLSTITPSPWFVSQVKALNVRFTDFGRHPGEELIVLTMSLRDYSDPIWRGKGNRAWIDYRDTAQSRGYRSELWRINDALARAALEFVGPDDVGAPLDTQKRLLKRFFSLPPGTPDDDLRFDLNGRLFGGWWQNLDKSLRTYIRIDGEPIADLDYASMFPRLAYIAAGHEPPSGDLYAIEGLTDYRDGVKRALNTLLFAEGNRVRLPADVKAELPRGWTVARMRVAIVEKHPALRDVIERGLGLRLMFTESQVRRSY